MKRERNIFKLHEAVLDDNIESVKSCIAEGADVNEENNSGVSPYSLARLS